ncbi:MAG TPA: glycosyltransferase [Verrucomicrobiae bacterium]|nr:glycosyltransferase [Verrucomicrobiae bacterium]
MKVSGFTFIRNGVELGYPFAPSIRSLLPLCDEIIVNVPRSTDDTLATVKAIGDPKIRIMETDWDDTLRHHGQALSHHTNLALQECTGDWCVYIQGDEVLHEDTLPAMFDTMNRELKSQNVQGLLVDYTHFYGSYWTYASSFGWYRREVRVVRRDPDIRSRGDAQGFRTVSGEKLRVKISGGHYFHYGHALPPELARRKLRGLSRLWHDDAAVDKMCDRPETFYEDDQKVERFTGTHPMAMQELIAAANWTYQSRNPFVRFRKKVFWNDLAYHLNNWTGLEIGVHKNYRLIK